MGIVYKAEDTRLESEIEESNNFTVFPNPFTAHLYLKQPADADHIELTNQLGQCMFSGKNIEEQDFFKLPKGVYFLKIIGVQSAVAKVLKE